MVLDLGPRAIHNSRLKRVCVKHILVVCLVKSLAAKPHWTYAPYSKELILTHPELHMKNQDLSPIGPILYYPGA